MEIKSIRAVYWSATDTTKTVVLRIAHGIANMLHCSVKEDDFTLPSAREITLNFSPNELVVLGTPTYAGRVPNVLLPFLTGKIHGNGALAVPVVLYGNRNYDDSLIELRNLLEQDGFHTVAAGAFVGEHAFSLVLAAGRPDDADLAVMDRFARQVAEKTVSLAEPPTAPVAVRGETPIRPYYTPRDRSGNPVDIRKVLPKTSDRCNRCGLCAAVCPMGSIDPEHVENLTGICIKCCACVKKCPQNAKYFDDPKFLYHKKELELGFARRAEPELFLGD